MVRWVDGLRWLDGKLGRWIDLVRWIDRSLGKWVDGKVGRW